MGLKIRFATIPSPKNKVNITSRICLASVVDAVIQATWRTELEDHTRTGVRLKRLQAHCIVCTSPTVMLNPFGGLHGSGDRVGAIILMLDIFQIAAVWALVVLNYSWCGVRLDHRRRKSGLTYDYPRLEESLSVLVERFPSLQPLAGAEFLNNETLYPSMKAAIKTRQDKAIST